METAKSPISKNSKKRDRSENWLSEDKNLLTELVRERVSIIENKNTDTNTNSKKQAAWADLLNSFNSMCKGSKRMLPQLKSQWGIIKMHQKRIKSTERKHLIATGGGPPPPQDPAINSEDISAWLPNEFVIDTNEFDSDQINQFQVKVGEPSPDVIISDLNQEDGITQEVLPVTNDEMNKLKKEENEIKVVFPLTNRLRKKKTGKKENENKTSTAANAIASVEIDCRKELHGIQMENERKKSRNLDLEEEILKKKLNITKRKIKCFK